MKRPVESFVDPDFLPEYKDAKIFMETLASSTTARGQKTVANLWAVCDVMIRTSEPITVAEVGRRLIELHGGPAAQAIRDQPERLKRLVELCAAVNPKVKTEKKSNDLAFLDMVHDQGARARLRLLLEELVQLRKSTTALRTAYGRLAPIASLTEDQCYKQITSPPSADLPTNKISDDELAAVLRFLDPSFQYEEGFRIDETLGWIAEESGRILLPLSFIQALRKFSGFI